MADRREQILRAATQLMTERGMSAISVRSVAAAAGIGASTLRHYFPTQRALYDAVVGQSFDDQLADLRIHDRTLPPGQRLTECVAQFLPSKEGSGGAELERWLALYASAWGPERSEQSRRLLAIFTERAQRRVGVWLAVLAAEDALRHGDLPRHAVVVLAMVDGLCLQLLGSEPTISVSQAHAILGEVVTQMVTATSVPALS